MRSFLLPLLFLFSSCFAQVKVGVDVLFEQGGPRHLLKGKSVGLITNHTAVNAAFELTLDVFRREAKDFRVAAVFVPEHGLFGDLYADKSVSDGEVSGIPVKSLFGKTRRPTNEMLAGIDILVYDIQDIGSRSYTYVSTLFYCMEEAAKRKIPFLVLDRPNPLGGMIVDGPLVEERWRSFLGYVNIPYCHGMTIGELAAFFNGEYNIGTSLVVIPMKGWKREMAFQDTALPWVPTSPQIPEGDTPFFYPATGIIGHLSLASIGIGYTLPFKIVGAPWIDGRKLAAKLNEQKLPGIVFQPFHFRPFFGKYKLENCQGVRLIITHHSTFLPFTTQYAILGVLKALYPSKFKEALDHLVSSPSKKEIFHELNGSEEILSIIATEPYFIWKLRDRFRKERDSFLPIRQKYLHETY